MDDIYLLADAVILGKIGQHLKTVRLKQNITQQSLAEAANVSLSTIMMSEEFTMSLLSQTAALPNEPLLATRMSPL